MSAHVTGLKGDKCLRFQPGPLVFSLPTALWDSLPKNERQGSRKTSITDTEKRDNWSLTSPLIRRRVECLEFPLRPHPNLQAGSRAQDGEGAGGSRPLAGPVPSLPVGLAHPPTRASGTGRVEGESRSPPGGLTALKPRAHSAPFRTRER